MTQRTTVKNKGNLTIFIFPYLFISKELEFDGFKLKPSFTSIVQSESFRLQGHLGRIARSFRLPETSSVNQYSYGRVTIHNPEEWHRLKGALDRLSTVLRYQELSDERKGAIFSNFDYAVVEVSKPMSKGGRDYYNCVLNGQNSLPIRYPITKFCPNHHVRPYVLDVDNREKISTSLLSMRSVYVLKSEEARVIRSLEWFNNSFKLDPEIDNYERYINVSIAFESLFNTTSKGDNLSNLEVGISTLLGRTPELIEWVKNFYDNRSLIVHGEEKPSLSYQDRRATESHLSHLLFARKVFVRCIQGILMVREGIYSADLHRELISNERRIKDILSRVRAKKKTAKWLYKVGTLDIIDSLSNKDMTGSDTDIVLIGKELLPLIRPEISKNKRVDLLKLLDEIVNFSDPDLTKLALIYGDFGSDFSSFYFDNKSIGVKDLYTLALKGAIYHFSGYVTWKLLTFNYP